MAHETSDTLRALTANPDALKFNRGVEREALRVDRAGNLARTPHPAFLGSKLTHPSITTDFSEAQLELITPVSDSIEDTLAGLDEIHRFVTQGLTDEILWSASMPCVLAGDNSIPLAQYGTSNVARLKTAYRNGLGQRYGRAMQTICAVHYNFSLPDALWDSLAKIEGKENTSDYKTERYFDLMRNFRRWSWLPVYLFGASPVVCNSFVKGREHNLERFDEGSLYARGATSLRSGNLGYNSDTQSGLINICYNSLENYVTSLAQAITTPHADYGKIGLKHDDEYLQVNDSVLQSEAEFYTSVRAKRVPPKGANFLRVLLDGGVEYLEIRLLDVNPYLALGIDAEQIRFLDVLLLHCLLTESPLHGDDLCNAVTENMQKVVWRGRLAETSLLDNGNERDVKEWGREIIDAMQPVARVMDEVFGGNAYRESLDTQERKVDDVSHTPSARVLADMKDESIPFFRFAMNKALAHRETFLDPPLPKERVTAFESIARQSFIDQKQIEDADTIDFDTYLENLNAEYLDLL